MQRNIKQTRKTGNLLIRQTSNKRSSRQQIPSNLKSKTNMITNANNMNITSTSNSHIEKDKKWQIKQQNLQIQKQITKAQNLSQQQIQKIQKQAQKTVSKKIKSSQIKIQNEMVSFLQLECNKLGVQLQKKQSDNSKLKMQVGQLRKNIDFLNRKLQNTYKDHDNLAKNNDYGQMQKQQMKQQIIKLKSILSRKQNETDFNKKKYQTEIQKLQSENNDLKMRVQLLQHQLNETKQSKDEFQQLLEEKTNQCQYIRQSFQQKKKQWDRLKQSFEANSTQTLQKKAEKIAKNQAQIQTLTDKLKQQQTFRKKALQKNKQLQKDIIKYKQNISSLQQQITQYKKRVNDLAILKSSNNTIMNQKIQKLQQQNAKLKKDIEIQTGKKPKQQESSKPFLFGPNDEDDY